MRIEGEVETFTTGAGPHGEFLLTVYQGNGPRIRTIAWRQHTADTWGPEIMLFSTAAGVDL